MTKKKEVPLEEMKLRDFFAVFAMQSILGRQDYNNTPADCIAIDAYALADAMLEARKK